MQFDDKSSAWSGRFNEPVADLVQRYTSSFTFDKRLAYADIRGSLAHAQMLSEQGIISTEDFEKIKNGLGLIKEEIQTNNFQWKLDCEDVHLNIEARLIALIGDAGKRIHTGRSRNDQVATDLRLWLTDEIDRILDTMRDCCKSLVSMAEQHTSTIMPGFTHLQIAQPIVFGHHLLAYVEMFRRDIERLLDCRRRVQRLPLGAAALAGTSYPIDRHRVAELLGFQNVCRNSLDAVSDRDFAIEFTAAASLIMMHFSRLSEELVLWMTPAFGFIEIADGFCTGSSIMPQKKNPDVPELARGKTGRVYGHLISLLTIMKSQPLAYNKDNQEDKEPLFDTVDTIINTAHIFAQMLSSIKINKDHMRNMASQGYATATDLADFCVRAGLPFREAHEAVALIVKHAIHTNRSIESLKPEELKQFLPSISNKLLNETSLFLTLEGSVSSRKHIGGTSGNQVQLAIQEVKEWLNTSKIKKNM